MTAAMKISRMAMNLQVLQLVEEEQAEQDAGGRYDQPDHQQRATVVAADRHQIEIRQDNIHLAAGMGGLRRLDCGGRLGLLRKRRWRPHRDHHEDRHYRSGHHAHISFCSSARLLLSIRPGSDIPPVRKIRIPSSTVRSG
jgi:hypothetical protein